MEKESPCGGSFFLPFMCSTGSCVVLTSRPFPLQTTSPSAVSFPLHDPDMRCFSFPVNPTGEGEAYDRAILFSDVRGHSVATPAAGALPRRPGDCPAPARLCVGQYPTLSAGL